MTFVITDNIDIHNTLVDIHSTLVDILSTLVGIFSPLIISSVNWTWYPQYTVVDSHSTLQWISTVHWCGYPQCTSGYPQCTELDSLSKWS